MYFSFTCTSQDLLCRSERRFILSLHPVSSACGACLLHQTDVFTAFNFFYTNIIGYDGLGLTVIPNIHLFDQTWDLVLNGLTRHPCWYIRKMMSILHFKLFRSFFMGKKCTDALEFKSLNIRNHLATHCWLHRT